MYIYDIKVNLPNTDAAGVVFYAQYYYWMHDAYETLLENHALSLSYFIQKNIYIPIQKSTCEYYSPLQLDNKLSIQLKTKHIEKDSFELEYTFLKNEKKVANGTTSHCCINNQAKLIMLPNELATVFKSII